MKNFQNTARKNLSTLSTSLNVEEWEIEVSFLKRFLKLTPENRGLFFALLGKESDWDSYLTSPSYYALTGRKGLWIYQNGNAYIPFCWHPNVEGQILVFPPRGEHNVAILKNLLMELPVPPNGIRLARIKEGEINSELLRAVCGTFGRSISLRPVEETVLDWKYPVRVLSTEKVMQMAGSHYLRTRNYMKLLQQKHLLEIKPLSGARYSQIIEFANRWAGKRTKDPLEIKELVSPYIETMTLLQDDAFNVDGCIFFVDGQVQAVSMWELPNTSTRIANALVHLCNTEYKGLSEFVMKTTSSAAWSSGAPFINYGGSETKGLDDYKNKFVPAYSLELRSVDAEIIGVDAVLHSLLEIQGMRIAA